MKTFNVALSREKRNKHIVNIIILAMLYSVGFYVGSGAFAILDGLCLTEPGFRAGILQAVFRQGLDETASPQHRTGERQPPLLWRQLRPRSRRFGDNPQVPILHDCWLRDIPCLFPMGYCCRRVADRFHLSQP